VVTEGGPADRLARRSLLATFDAERVIVWQAHSEAVAAYAVSHGRFGGPDWRAGRQTRFRFSLPSVLARTEWGTRPGRERILAVWVTRSGVETLLNQAVHAEADPAVYTTPMAWRLATRYANVSVSWHVDVDLLGAALPRETPRLGVRDLALRQLAEEFTVGIDDWTEWVRTHRQRPEAAVGLPPLERLPLAPDLAARLAGVPVGGR
jgi:Domain of unknown function (DUF4291)